MRRRLLGIGVLLALSVLGYELFGPMVGRLWAQARAGSFWRFARPGAPGTTEAELWYDSTNAVTNLTITGDFASAGGYKQTLAFSHADFTVASLSQSHIPLAGTVRVPLAGGANDRSGVVRAAYAGSVIGVVLNVDRVMTNGDAHAQVWTRTGTASPVGTLRSGVVQAGTQVARNTQAKDTNAFAAGDDFGCWLFTAGTAPTGVVPTCVVIVEY